MLFPMFGIATRPPPTPINVGTELYDGTKVRLFWDGNTPLDFVQVRIGEFGAPTELGQGSSSWNSGQFNTDLWVRFRRASKFSEWVSGVL